MANSILDLGVPSHDNSDKVRRKLQIKHTLVQEFPGDSVKGLGEVQRRHEATKERNRLAPLMLVMQVFVVLAELCSSGSTMGKSLTEGIVLRPTTLIGILREVGNLRKNVGDVGLENAAQHFFP